MGTRRRPIVVIGASALAAILLAGGWLVSAAFESPAQKEAKVAPPAQAPITAKVERGNLTETVTFRGSVQRQERASVQLPTQSSDEAVVTRAPIGAGASIGAGTVVSEVNGRPIIALPGAFAFYRTLRFGDSGPDVRQLQAGLSAAGIPVGQDGAFGTATAQAIRALYARSGYEPETAPVPPAPSHKPPGPDSDPADDGPPTEAEILPKSEVIALGALPGVLVGGLPVGTVVTSDSAITLERGSPRVTATVPKLTAETLHTGDTGTIRSSPTASATIRVEAIGSEAKESSTVSVTLVGADERPLGDEWLGRQVTVALELKNLATDALIVPTIAVSPGGRGAAHVLVGRSGGTFQRIAVTEVAQLDGRSAVKADSDHAISAGDLVKVD